MSRVFAAHLQQPVDCRPAGSSAFRPAPAAARPVRTAASTSQAGTLAANIPRPGQAVELVTQSDCQLAVSIYPMFAYDASAGTGFGPARPAADGRTYIEFDPATLVIPALTWRTTRVFGVPLPPPLKIEIVPRSLGGWVDYKTGQAELDFDAEFNFSGGPIYKADSLQVKTTLTTEAAEGKIRSGTGQRLVGGKGKLLGIARVPKTGDIFLDTFLQLPTDAYAMLSAEFRPVEDDA